MSENTPENKDTLIVNIEKEITRGNTQRAMMALLDSIRHLMQHAKETNAALANLAEVASAKPSEATEETAEPEATRKPAKKTTVKKTGGEPTPDMLKSNDEG